MHVQGFLRTSTAQNRLIYPTVDSFTPPYLTASPKHQFITAKNYFLLLNEVFFTMCFFYKNNNNNLKRN